MSKRGLSTIVTTVILVVMVFVLVSIVWTTVNNLITRSLEKAESCFGNFEKVTINNKYTCYNHTTNETQFSINIKEIDVDGAIISISVGGGTKSYALTNDEQSIPGLGPYPSGSGSVKLPGKNAGLTYISSNFSEKPSSIQIAPIINEKQCEVSDSLFEIGFC